ncbi:hypothetical protein F5B20DRAFT_116817 [Whalleya microplaca]|nr:hypothetical protein F5B20DRAFT_116817 [Whalleya microplaca]
MIYEYALYVDEPIKPQQITPYSNRFVSNDTREFYCGRFLPNQLPIKVASLSRTCREIYEDLDEYPVFYRVNKFWFEDMVALHEFLAAITQRRREMIRTIQLQPPYHLYGELSLNGPIKNRDWKKYDAVTQVLRLLCQCDDLRNLTLVVKPFYQRKNSNNYERVFQLLMKMQEFVFKLPYFQLVVVFPDNTSIRFADPKTISNRPAANTFANPGVINSFVGKMVEALKSRKERLVKEEAEGRGFLKEYKNNITAQQLRDAISSSLVHFVGENRISQDLFNDSIGTVSSRTRQRCQTEVDSSGLVTRETPKYAADGRLTCEFKIYNIRKIESEIECEVRSYEHWMDDEDDEAPRSWEPIHAIISYEGEAKLKGFFQDLVKKPVTASTTLKELKSAPQAITLLGELNNTPSPLEVIKVGGGIAAILSDAPERYQTKQSHKAMEDIWKKLQKKYEKKVAEVEEQASVERSKLEEHAQRREQQARRPASEKAASRKRKATETSRKPASTKAAKKP